MSEIVNRNFLSPLNFKFTLKRAPYVNFFVQSVNIPGLSLPPVDTNNPLLRVPYQGDHLLYDELNIDYKVDEDMQNYMELHEWIRALGKRSFSEYRELSTKSSTSGEGLRSDISLIVLTSNKNANYEVVFKDCIPISVSGVKFNTTATDVDYIRASASFRYVSYDITRMS